jgi:hypothetical protein
MKVYIEDPRNPAMTGDSLRARGHCCRSACLHCPYGFTIKKYRLEFTELNEANQKHVDKLLPQLDMKPDLKEYSAQDYRMISLKGFIFGIMRKDKLFVKEFELLPSFRNQGITKEVIESYFFY